MPSTSSKAHLDDSELRNLEADLRGAPGRSQRGINKVVRRGAALIDVQMTIDATGHKGNWHGVPGTEFDTPLQLHVSHEMIDYYTAEIGIETSGAGKLAHIIAYGSVNNAPAYDPTAGPRRALPAVIDMAADMGEDAVLGHDAHDRST